MKITVGPPLALPKITVGLSVRPEASTGAPSTVQPVSVGPGAAGVPVRTIFEGGDMYYEQDFAVAASTWAVTHNFGKSPNVRIVDHNGNTAYPATQDSTDLNTVYVEWPAPMTGKAICS